MFMLAPKLHNEANLLSKQALFCFQSKDKEVELKLLYSK